MKDNLLSIGTRRDNFQFFFFGKYSRIYLVASIIEVVGIVNFYERAIIVSQSAIQYDIINNKKGGAYYGNKKCKCNGSCAAGD